MLVLTVLQDVQPAQRTMEATVDFNQKVNIELFFSNCSAVVEFLVFFNLPNLSQHPFAEQMLGD